MRRTLRILLGIVISLAVFSGIAAAGVQVAMASSFQTGAQPAPARGWPAPRPVTPGRISVAVVVGAGGSVVSDVLAPFEVFARSDRFTVHTVAQRRVPVALSGGLRVLPDYTIDEMPAPDVVVVPAVADPAGSGESALRAWIARQAARGARILGVCNGAELLAAAGVLDDHPATAFWSNVSALQRGYPKVRWVRGERYVQDGPLTTTAGVTSGTVGALRLVEQLAGAAEADRIGGELRYPGWAPDATTRIPVHHLALADLPYALGAAFPWGRPDIGVRLADGTGEIDAAAVFEVWAGASFAARLVPVAAGATVTTRHGMVLVTTPEADAPHLDRLIVPGAGDPGDGFPYDAMLRDLAAHTDRATTMTTAKFIEYPSAQLALTGSSWPARTTALAVATLILAVAAGLLPALIRRRRVGRALIVTGTGNVAHS
jgi:putative intracellular protease/amidase